MWVKDVNGRLLNLDNAETIGIKPPMEVVSTVYTVTAMMTSGYEFIIVRGDKKTCQGTMNDIQSGVMDEDAFYDAVTREGFSGDGSKLGLIASALEEISIQGRG